MVLGVISLGMIVATIYVVINFLKNLTNIGHDKVALNAVVTQGVVWVGAFLVLLVAAHAGLTQHLAVLGTTFGSLNFGDLVLLALGFGSTASTSNDLLGALDSSRTTKTAQFIKE